MLSDLRFRVPLMVLIAVVLHTTVLAQVRVFGVMPDVMLLLAVAAGLEAGPGYGATIGFTSGMLSDLLLPTPLGLSALVFTVVGYVVGVTKGGLLRSTWWFPVGVALVASAAGQALFALVGTVIGEEGLLTRHLTAIVIVVALTNAILAVPILRLARWSLAGRPPDRAYAE
ncbi:MAG: rod shape-determining protein MreD [Actinomycetota bacterium]|nr:rod shape-determining protein MreD [Actinomycetota bacterium]